MEYLANMFHRVTPYSYTRMRVETHGAERLDPSRLIARVAETLVSRGRRANTGTQTYSRATSHLKDARFLEGGVIPLRERTYVGGVSTGDGQHVLTQTTFVEDSSGRRRVWAMENLYQVGPEFLSTQWLTYVGIEQIDDTQCTLAIRRSYARSFDATFFNPALKPGTTLWELLQSPDLRFAIGNETLNGLPQFVGSDISVQRFVEHLSRTERAPAVLVPRTTDFDASRLARDVAGHATVFAPTNEATEDTLSKILDIPLQDGIQHTTIFRPGQPNYWHVKPIRQRALALERHLREQQPHREHHEAGGPDDTLETIVSNVFHFGIAADTETVVAPSDVDERIRRETLHRLRASHSDTTELLQLFEEENGTLSRRLSKRERELRAGEVARQELTAERDALRQEVLGLKARVGAITSSRPQIDAPDVRTLPKNLLDAVDFACRIYQHKLFATEAARVSAESAPDADLERAWRCLYDMANVLHPLHFKEGLPLRTIAKRFQEETGFEIAVHESESTRSNDRLAAMRAQTYNGEVLDISTHIKIGNKRGKALRVHYAPHVVDQRIIIGHFGAHLPTGKDR